MRVVTLDRVGSTNDEAVARADAGDQLPICVRALEQVSGRGRLGREWSSPRGGVWMSVAGAWSGVVPGSVALRAALAVADAVAAELPGAETERLAIKWPNDLLLRRRKVAGVLCERRVLASGSACLVIGVGINADFEEALLPSDVRAPATTLRAALGRAIDAERIAERLVDGLDGVLARSGDALDQAESQRVLERLAFLDEPVRFSRLDGTVVEGSLAGLAPDGRAAIRVGEGIEWVAAGDVDGARPENA